jgi:hypothetical protein
MTYSHDGPVNTSQKSFPLSLQHISRHDASSGWSRFEELTLKYVVFFEASLKIRTRYISTHPTVKGVKGLDTMFYRYIINIHYNNQLKILTPLRISIVHKQRNCGNTCIFCRKLFLWFQIHKMKFTWNLLFKDYVWMNNYVESRK